MTAGTAEKVYRLRDGRVTPAMGAVLTYLAYRAYYEDGRCAWPSLDTIAACVFLSKRTVIRAIAALIDLGYVRENPNQQWNTVDSETGEWKRKGYRTVVYDVLTERFARVADASEERVTDELAGMASQGCQNVTPEENVGTKPVSQECQNVTPEPGRGRRGDIVTGERCQNVTQLTNDQLAPPTPSGYPPASGGTPDGMGGAGSDTVADRVPSLPDAGDDGDVWSDASRSVCSRLAGARRDAGLSVPECSPRDLRAVSRLLGRLDSGGVADPQALVCRVAVWAASHRYWARRIRSGRQLASHWDELADEHTLDRVSHAVQAPPTVGGMARSVAHTHWRCCCHVLALLGADRDSVELDPSLMALACALADRLNAGVEGAAALEAARADVVERVEERRREEAARADAVERLRRAREANGGSMFHPFGVDLEGGV